MTPSRPDLSVSRLELIVLARLSSAKSPSDRELAIVIEELALLDAHAHPDQIATTTLAQLRRRGLVHEPTQQARQRRTLTDQGVRTLRAAFDLDKTPLWKDIHNTHLLARALGLEPGSQDATTATKDATTIASIVVRNQYKVARPSEIADKMIADALGLPPGPITLTRLRAHMLAKEAGVTPGLTPKQIMVKLAAKVIGQPCTDKKTMRQALIRRWVYEASGGSQVVDSPRATGTQGVLELPGKPTPTPVKPTVQATKPIIMQPPVKPPVPAPVSPTPQPVRGADTLLNLVREAIPRVGADGRFGAEKVFVSAIWRRIEHDTRLPNLSFDRFKTWLVTANRDQLLDLARADVVGAMDPKLVAESAIEDLGATFHFVIDRRVNGARGVHAR
jgi:hypothetical protein